MHLVVLFGPPAVGKMTVGHELCRLTGYRLFHNHLTIEPFLGIFEFGSPSFARLSSEFRRRVLEEAIVSGLPGLVFTFVWALQLEEDRDPGPGVRRPGRGRRQPGLLRRAGVTPRRPAAAQQHRVPAGREEVEARPRLQRRQPGRAGAPRDEHRDRPDARRRAAVRARTPRGSTTATCRRPRPRDRSLRGWTSEAQRQPG